MRLICLWNKKIHSWQDYDTSVLWKWPKTTTTNREFFYAVCICTKFSTKNRTKWIFTNSPKGCIIRVPSKVTDPRRCFIFPAQPPWVSAKYQSNDIPAQRKQRLCFPFFTTFSGLPWREAFFVQILICRWVKTNQGESFRSSLFQKAWRSRRARRSRLARRETSLSFESATEGWMPSQRLGRGEPHKWGVPLSVQGLS